MAIPYYSVLEAAVHRTETYAKDNPLRHANDPGQVNLIVQAALRNPDWTANQILEWCGNRSRAPIKLNVVGFLRQHYILKKDGREGCSQEIARQYENLKAVLHGEDDVARSAYVDLKDRESHLRRSWPVVARMVLLSLGRTLHRSEDRRDQALGTHLEDVLNRVLLRPSSQLLSQIVTGIAEERHLAQRQSVSEKLTGLIQQVTGLQEEASEEETTDVEVLQYENADLRSALFGLTQELTDLQLRIQEMQESTKTEAIVAFLSEMNSAASGYLLDNIMQSNRLALQMLSSGWLPEPPEVEGVVYSLKMLLDYMKAMGVLPIASVGDRARIVMEDLARFSYAGSEFRDEREKKWVEYRSTGWMYKGTIISLPRVVELLAQNHTEGR
jgi:molecular chaperone GrpE (heat shock protein)